MGNAKFTSFRHRSREGLPIRSFAAMGSGSALRRLRRGASAHLRRRKEIFSARRDSGKVVIKRGLGRADFKVDARLLRRGLLDNGYSELPIGSEHVVAIDNLLRFTRSLDRGLRRAGKAQVEGIHHV